jgi:hypothetical protein
MVLFGVSIDFVAVIAAAAVAFIFGVIWFAPPLLGKYWIEKSKQNNSAKAGIGKTIGSSIVSCLLTAFVLEVILMALHLSTWASSVELAALVWAGFYFAKEFAAVMSGDRTMKVFASIMIHDGIAILLTVAVLFALR